MPAFSWWILVSANYTLALAAFMVSMYNYLLSSLRSLMSTKVEADGEFEHESEIEIVLISTHELVQALDFIKDGLEERAAGLGLGLDVKLALDGGHCDE